MTTRDFSRASWRLKLARAQKHLEEFQAKILAFVDADPYKVRRDKNAHQNPYIWRYVLHLTEQVDEDVAVIAGDIVHNLRSALDHLAVALAPGKPRWSSAFPIEGRRLWAKDSSGAYIIDDDEPRKRFVKLTEGMHPEAVTIIKALQPGASSGHPDKHPLRILSRLSNADKHARLIAVLSGVRNVEVFLFHGNRNLGWYLAEGLCEDGAVIADHAFSPREMPPESEVEVHTRGTPVVALRIGLENGKVQLLPAFHAFARLIEQIPGEVFDALEPFIPS